MPRILVVEHDERLRFAMESYLSSRGAHTIAADTTSNAISALDDGEIDLIVLDLKFAIGCGMDVLRHIRGSPGLMHLPVLAVSALDVDPTFYDYLEPGDYVIEPFDMRVLDMTIQQLLASVEVDK